MATPHGSRRTGGTAPAWRSRRAPAWLLLCLLPSVTTGAGDAEAVYSERGADTCLVCHRDPKTLAVFDGRHGNRNNPHGPFGRGQLQCEACHGPGGTHAARPPAGEARPPPPYFGRDGEARDTAGNARCTACHTGHGDDPLGNSGHAELSCAACHVSHDESGGGIAATPEEGCTDCHRNVRASARKPYSHLDGFLTCGDCHRLHEASGPSLLLGDTLNETCYDCHDDKRGPVLFEHAPVTEDCSSCHDPHGSQHPAMLVRRGPFLCQGCHSEAGHPSEVFAAAELEGASPASELILRNCMNCHTQVHGSNHPSGATLMR
ncbi:MAG: DmsE family decaheme c-type cytochrome [Pseudomonadota bacterium]